MREEYYTHFIVRESSAIDSIFYNEPNRRLYVNFHSDPYKWYLYEDVPKTVFDYLGNSYSLGRAWSDWNGKGAVETLNQNSLRFNYLYKKIFKYEIGDEVVCATVYNERSEVSTSEFWSMVPYSAEDRIKLLEAKIDFAGNYED